MIGDCMDNKIKNASVMNLIKLRRSVRQFTGTIIPDKDVRSIIEAGIWAPTGCNNQELRYLVIDKIHLSDVIAFKPFLKGVSHFIIIFADYSSKQSKAMYEKDRSESHLPYIDAGLSIMNMILYAKSIGIDSCICNLSPYHLRANKSNQFLKYINKIKIKLGFRQLASNSFNNYQLTNLKLSSEMKVLCGIAFGYAKIYPDVNCEIHGGKKIMRSSLDNYIIK
jgi:nitroreductase